MVEGPNNGGFRALVDRVRPPRDIQLELPLEGIPSARRVELMEKAKEFAKAMPAKLGSGLLFRVGVPMVAATTPAVLDTLTGEREHSVWSSLLVGSALGGTWGALVGAAIPNTSVAALADGVKVSRLKGAGMGASKGIVMAPAVAVVSKLVADYITAPIRQDLDDAEDRVRDAEADAGTGAPAPSPDGRVQLAN